MFKFISNKILNFVDKPAKQMAMKIRCLISTMCSLRCKNRTNSTQCASNQSFKALLKVKMLPLHSLAHHSQERRMRSMGKQVETVESSPEQSKMS